MFEKEAEEYGEKDLGGKYLSSVVAKDKLHAYKLGQYDGFVAGAEFGYNKAKEELEKDNNRLFLEGAKRVEELEAQIEKMKCCGNCKYFNFNEPNYCHKGVYRERQYVCSEWEFGN